jgi:hypothetical protein
MNTLIQAWLDACDKVREAHAACEQAEEDAQLAPLPQNLRPATSRDIVEGAILWYPEWNERKWALVGDVRHPNDQWKAYTAQDGCRYGLDGAFVEVASGVTEEQARRPFGWYCELVHVKSGEVVNANFFRDGPITGAGKVRGTKWRVTPVYLSPER